jgi:hypothetical protein
MVNIGFHRGGVGAQLISGNDARLDGLLHDPLMDLLGTFLAKERKTPTEITKIGNRIFISIHTTKDGKEAVFKEDAEPQRNFLLFESALGAISRPFFATTDELDEILEEANS